MNKYLIICLVVLGVFAWGTVATAMPSHKKMNHAEKWTAKKHEGPKAKHFREKPAAKSRRVGKHEGPKAKHFREKPAAINSRAGKHEVRTSKHHHQKSLQVSHRIHNRDHGRHHVKHNRVPRAHVVLPSARHSVVFQFGVPIFLPGFAPLPSHYPYYINESPYQRWPDHCSFILGYSQQGNLPYRWSVEAFNTEVVFCRTAYYPTLPVHPVPQGPPPPTVQVPTPAPQSYNYGADDAACRDLAYQASQGGPSAGKTIEGAIMGGMLGAAAGAAIGAAAGDAGQGAAIGAAVGGFGGAAANNIEADEQYKRAYFNCMENRGHLVLN